MKRRMRLFGSAVAVFVAAGAFAQSGTLDQVSPIANASFNVDASFLVWQQQVRAGMDGVLEGVEMEFTQGFAGSEVVFRVRLGDAWSGGSALYEETFVKQGGGVERHFFDASGANIELSEGDTFVIETVGTDTGVWLTGSYVDPGVGDPLYPEPLYLNQAFYSNGGWRHGFNTYMLEGGVFTLEVTGSCPGELTATANGATSGGTVAFVFGLNTGSSSIPSGPCAGTQLGLDRTARLVGTATADGSGVAELTGRARVVACGHYLQALDVSTCSTTDVVLF